jgi:hypothetical protein
MTVRARNLSNLLVIRFEHGYVRHGNQDPGYLKKAAFRIGTAELFKEIIPIERKANAWYASAIPLAELCTR